MCFSGGGGSAAGVCSHPDRSQQVAQRLSGGGGEFVSRRLRSFAQRARLRRHAAILYPPPGRVRHLRKVCQDAASRLRSHGVSAERDARADVQHDSTGFCSRPHATGTQSNTHRKSCCFGRGLSFQSNIINQKKNDEVK